MIGTLLLHVCNIRGSFFPTVREGGVVCIDVGHMFLYILRK